MNEIRLLIVVGAGASFDCMPDHATYSGSDLELRLPLANDLFSPQRVQNHYLQHYGIIGLANKLRSISRKNDGMFDVELELANIAADANKRSDLNVQQSLFKTRFYIQSLIRELAEGTINFTQSSTIYIDLLNLLKDWIDQSPDLHSVDIVVFNYDDLIEKAMSSVFPHDWNIKSKENQMRAYYQGNNLRIFKPHGSINWGREILKNGDLHDYNSFADISNDFNKIKLTESFKFVNPSTFQNVGESKNCIPAIAVPFKEKTDFSECPPEMFTKLYERLQKANKVMTLGWKGTDVHFTNLLETNENIEEIYVVSPKADTNLSNIFSQDMIKPIKSTFSYFVSNSAGLEALLSTL